ncbi:MAG: prolipoprotein diacylglyceryl transferase [Methylococcales bacterium]|nr:prolipoprotein diacylglyceryl transferase [Methylococcales bacterium]
MSIHLIFDLLALLSGIFVSAWFRKKYGLKRPIGIIQSSQYDYYLITLLVGLIGGSVILGTLNIYLAGYQGVAKSMLGGIFGAIVAAEIFKYFSNIRQSTGLYFIPGLLILIIVGRVGCFLAGLDDFTYGVETSVPWGVNFGDDIKRHPVQLYESLTMFIFLIILLIRYPKNPLFWQRHGFYLFVGVYAGQRFIWEFLKPYPYLWANFNLFHLLSFLLILYALWMLTRKQSSPLTD